MTLNTPRHRLTDAPVRASLRVRLATIVAALVATLPPCLLSGDLSGAPHSNLPRQP